MCAQVNQPDPQPVTIAKVLTEELQIWHSHATRITCNTPKGLGSVDDNVLAVCMSLDTRDKVAIENANLSVLSPLDQTYPPRTPQTH